MSGANAATGRASGGAAGARPLLQVEDLSVDYGGVPALSDVSLHVATGEIVALLGRNGAGKTTTLRAIAGLQRLRSGSIRVGDTPVHDQPPHLVAATGCTLVPEGNRVFRRLTVAINLRLGAYRVSRAEAERRMAEQFARFPVLAAKRDLPAGQLSGGEQQMLAIAQGLMARPRVLLLDEPSVGLAVGLVRQSFAELRRLADDGLAILLAEQGVEAALAIADRAVVLELGRVVVADTAEALRRPGALDDAYLGRRVSG